MALIFSIEQLSSSNFPWVDTTGEQWDQSRIRTQAETDLIQSCTHFVYLYYYYCQLANQWGESGESVQRETIMRLALQVPYNADIEPRYDIEFERHLKTQYTRFGILDYKTEDELEAAIDRFRINFLGTPFRIHDAETINGYLRNLNSALYLQAGAYGVEQELILGRGRHSQLGEYQVIDLTEEICHTANVNITLAAAIGHQQILIRHYSLRSIFEIKWRSFLEFPYPADSANARVGAIIKTIVCEQYQFKTNSVNRRQEDQFIQEMRDSILYHEVGHGIIQHHALPFHIGTFSESTKIISHPVIHTLLETLAEIAPKHDDCFGPLYYFCNLSEIDPDKATRQFWMYISDTWFFDTDSDYMYLYSELVEKIFLAGAKSNTDFNFTLIQNLIWGPDGIYSYLVNQTISICNDLILLLQTQTYGVDGAHLDFETLKTIKQNELESDAPFTPTGYVMESALWAKILETALTNPTLKTTILTMLDTFQAGVVEGIQTKTGLSSHGAVLDKIQTMDFSSFLSRL